MRKRILPVIMVMLTLLMLVVPAYAQTWEGEDYTFEVPDDLYILTKDTSITDPVWELAGFESSMEQLETYEEMNAKANFVSLGGSINILVTQKASDASKGIHSINEATPEEKEQVLEHLAQTESGEIKIEREWISTPEIDFFRLDIRGMAIEDEEVHELIYGTMINGYTLVLDSYSLGGEISPETDAMMRKLVESFHITNAITKEEANLATRRAMIPSLIILAVLVLLIVFLVVFTSYRSKKDKRVKKQMADKLAAYRQKHGNQSVPEGEPIYMNTTEVSFDMIRKFSIYHSYIKNLPGILGGLFLCIAMIVLTVKFASEWWVMLLSFGLAIYYIYKLITTSTKVEKVQKDIYTRGKTSLAKYSFNDESFGVSGYQTARAYPYFQITEVREYGGFFYLYYGPDNAYILDKSEFSMGKSDEFGEFIKGKVKNS